MKKPFKRRTHEISVHRVGDDEIQINWGNNEEDPSVRFPVTQAEQISGWILEVAKEIQDNPKPESPTE